MTSPKDYLTDREKLMEKIIQIISICEARIELFARQKTEGWDVWGNEVKSDIDL